MAAKLKQQGGKVEELNSDMNVTPFVDVMLVLLIIFMVAAPLATVSIRLDLPPASPPPPGEEQEEPVFISIQDDTSIYVVDEETTLENLIPALNAALARAEPARRARVRPRQRGSDLRALHGSHEHASGQRLLQGRPAERRHRIGFAPPIRTTRAASQDAALSLDDLPSFSSSRPSGDEDAPGADAGPRSCTGASPSAHRRPRRPRLPRLSHKWARLRTPARKNDVWLHRSHRHRPRVQTALPRVASDPAAVQQQHKVLKSGDNCRNKGHGRAHGRLLQSRNQSGFRADCAVSQRCKERAS